MHAQTHRQELPFVSWVRRVTAANTSVRGKQKRRFELISSHNRSKSSRRHGMEVAPPGLVGNDGSHADSLLENVARVDSGESPTQIAKQTWDDGVVEDGSDEETNSDRASVKLEKLRVSIVYIDHYSDPETRMPVIRIFGRDPEGKESYCVHVKECLPYLFVKVKDNMDVNEFIQRLKQVLEDSRFRNSVHSLSACKAVDFYGFHSKEKPEEFVKIDVTQPMQLKNIGVFLQSGHHELNMAFQPYETHVPFLLQFLSDYKLAGMGYIRLGDFVPREKEKLQTGQNPIKEVNVHVNHIIVEEDSRRDSFGVDEIPDMKVPSLKEWLIEIRDSLQINPFTEGEDQGVSRSASLGSQRSSASIDEAIRNHISLWLENNDELPQLSLQRESEVVPTSEAINILATLNGEQPVTATASCPEDFEGEEDENEEDERESLAEKQFMQELEQTTQSSIEGWDDDVSRSKVLGDDSDHEKFEESVKSPNRRTRSPVGATQASDFSHGMASSASNGIQLAYLRPKQDPPLLDDIDTDVKLRNTMYHQKPFYSHTFDAKLDLEDKKGNRGRDPDAWVPLRRQLSVEIQREVFLSPKSEPPSIERVIGEIENTRNKLKQEAKFGIEERVDKGARTKKDDSSLKVTPFRHLIFEILAKTTTKRSSNPNLEGDEILCIYAAVFEDSKQLDEAFIMQTMPDRTDRDAAQIDEHQLLSKFAEFVQKNDPDVIGGWEIQRYSLGFLLKRAKMLGLKTFAAMLSRVPNGPQDSRHLNDPYGEKEYSAFWLPGRHVLNVWRIIRKEMDLPLYTLENVVKELFSRPLARFSASYMQSQFENSGTRHIALDHLALRVHAVHDILLHLDLITKNAEFSKLLGMDFFSTLTRGSQYRVESVLLRIAKPMDYVLPSPSREQVATQPPLEVIALNLEPVAEFFVDPVAVMDFRSLYPSVIIAYNLCFSTLVGRYNLAKRTFETETGVFNVIRCDRKPGLTREEFVRLVHEDKLLILSTGAVFVKNKVREGILPLMLREILFTRFAMKDALKKCAKENRPNWRRVLDARQLALKLLANVTYGYTSASFSGRMPNSTIADAIVTLGKQSLERCQREVSNAEAPWARECPVQPRVVYGDTDSLFVLFRNCRLDSAFRISKWMTEQFTTFFPQPIKLQMEKIYLPSLLVAKKRYCGMKYEVPPKPGDSPAKIESKGLENIRRDSCPIMQKVMNDMLLEAFTSRDMTKTKKIFQQHISAILDNEVSVSDFVFASKVRTPIETSYMNGRFPPSAKVALNMAKVDSMRYPVWKERVQFVITYDEAPSSRLVDMVRPPSRSANINAKYYIKNKIMNPLKRLFRLANVNLDAWYAEIRQNGGLKRPRTSRKVEKLTGLQRHFKANACAICGTSFSDGSLDQNIEETVRAELDTDKPICKNCLREPQLAAVVLAFRDRHRDQVANRRLQQCRSCTGVLNIEQDTCQNTSCPIFFINW